MIDRYYRKLDDIILDALAQGQKRKEDCKKITTNENNKEDYFRDACKYEVHS